VSGAWLIKTKRLTFPFHAPIKSTQAPTHSLAGMAHRENSTLTPAGKASYCTSQELNAAFPPWLPGLLETLPTLSHAVASKMVSQLIMLTNGLVYLPRAGLSS
jgi:hypothetical protein